MTSFAYPKQLHVRREAPPRYERYQSYRPYIEREFSNLCVYCRKPATITPGTTFGIDHYRPVKHFPLLEKEYINLYYCCGACNSRKGSYWPVTPDAIRDNFVPNPCDHIMWNHLRFTAETVTARTKPGLFALELLDLNDPETLGFRRFVLRTLETAKSKIAEVNATAKKVRKAIASGAVTAAEGEKDLADLEVQRIAWASDVARLTGG